jgi:hypothetical protein
VLGALPIRRLVAGLVAVALAGATAGCATTRIMDRERIADDAMRFDPDGSVAFLRGKIEGAREGALGGYGESAAGGCGCE